MVELPPVTPAPGARGRNGLGGSATTVPPPRQRRHSISDGALDPENFTVNLHRKFWLTERMDAAVKVGPKDCAKFRAKQKPNEPQAAFVSRCAFSPEKHSLVAHADTKGFVTIQDLNTPKLEDAIKGIFRHGDHVNCLAFSRDGSMLAVGGGKVDDLEEKPRLRVYAVNKLPSPRNKPFKLVRAYVARSTVLDLSFAESGELAYGGIELPLKVVKGPTPDELENAQTLGAPPGTDEMKSDADHDPITSEEVTPAERVWNHWMKRSRTSQSDRTPPSLYSVSFSPCATSVCLRDGQKPSSTYLACVSKTGILTVMKKKEGVSCWTGEVDCLYDRRESGANPARTTIVSSACCRFSPKLDGCHVLLAVALMNGTVIVRDAASGYLRYVLDCGAPGFSVSFSPERSLLAVATSRGIRIYDSSTGAEAYNFEGERTETVCFSSSGFAIAYGTAAHPSHFGFRSLRIDTVERVVMVNKGTEIHERYESYLKTHDKIPPNSPHRPTSRDGQMLLRPRESATKSTNETDRPFTHAAIAASDSRIVVAAVTGGSGTEGGKLMVHELEQDDHGKTIGGRHVTLDTKVISPKCVALSLDQSDDKAFVAYEDSSGENRILSVMSIEHCEDESGENLLQLKKMDYKKARKNGKNDKDTVGFARVAFSQAGNLLVCFNQTRELAVFDRRMPGELFPKRFPSKGKCKWSCNVLKKTGIHNFEGWVAMNSVPGQTCFAVFPDERFVVVPCGVKLLIYDCFYPYAPLICETGLRQAILEVAICKDDRDDESRKSKVLIACGTRDGELKVFSFNLSTAKFVFAATKATKANERQRMRAENAAMGLEDSETANEAKEEAAAESGAKEAKEAAEELARVADEASLSVELPLAEAREKCTTTPDFECLFEKTMRPTPVVFCEFAPVAVAVSCRFERASAAMG